MFDLKLHQPASREISLYDGQSILLPQLYTITFGKGVLALHSGLIGPPPNFAFVQTFDTSLLIKCRTFLSCDPPILSMT